MQLIWDSINVRKVVGHRVEPAEIEEAFEDKGAHIRRAKSTGPKRYQMVARTESGRYLRVIFERLDEGVRVVTAFDAPDRDLRLYKRN